MQRKKKEEVILAEETWKEFECFHQERTRQWVEGRLSRQRRGEKHPVEDFLFDYYPFRPSLLQRWSPGCGVVLSGIEADKFLSRTLYSRHPQGVWLDPVDFPANRFDGLQWAIRILGSIESREPQFKCFGLHEWAMVYRAKKGRHEEVPLRMKPEALAEFVESQRICCSHYDAFRFFTPQARPLNLLQPEKGLQPSFEQGGCLHVNMDLYKWAYKFSPWVPSDCLADAFAQARTIREIDMRASPYDLRDYGFQAIPIETVEGRQEYEAWQRKLANQVQPIRRRLLESLQELLDSISKTGT